MVDLSVDFNRNPYLRNVDNRTIVDSVVNMKTESSSAQSSKFILGEQKNNQQTAAKAGKTGEEKAKKSKKKDEQAKKSTKNETSQAENDQRMTNDKSKTKDKAGDKGRTYCQTCKKKCSGEVLRVQDKYFHNACFKCIVCKNSLAQGGFFCKDGNYYCTTDYQKQYGTKCAVCGDYVEGDVVTALGNTYHQKCFTCARCRQAFPSGERVTYTGKEVLCAKCMQIPVREAQSLQSSPTSTSNTECAGCKEEIKEGQALIALGRQWHIWCFKCKTCNAVLHGEYMGKDGIPYCEKDYQKSHGVKCAYCSRYISGKVLQAGENHHFHPTCARCTKCGDPFGDGEEMYLQGGAIWHPRCGPGPTENGTILNGAVNGHSQEVEVDGVKEPHRNFETSNNTDYDHSRSGESDRISNSAASETQFSLRSRTPSLNGSMGSQYNSLNRKYNYQRAGSPGLLLREYKSPHYREDISRIYTYSYLTDEPSQGYLKKPIDPYDKPPISPHFHRPHSSHSLQGSSKSSTLRSSSRSGMRVLVDSIRSETPRPRSPHMNNEEPIELSHYPAGHPPNPGEKSKIERDDFPAPPYPYTDPERRRRWSDSYKAMSISDDDEDVVDGVSMKEVRKGKLKKEEEELSKIASGIGKVFLQSVRDREKQRAWKQSHLDPRNASRFPSASREPNYRLRYQSPVNAFVSSHNVAPRPGYGLKSSTLPATTRFDSGDFSFSGLGEKTHSTDFSSGKSDLSGGSNSEVEHGTLGPEYLPSTTYPALLGLDYTAGYFSPYLRHSLPNMAAATTNSTDPAAKIYPYHLLLTTNYRLPADTDRCNLERHLSDVEFEILFQCSRTEFYRLPKWRRNELKRRAKLF